MTRIRIDTEHTREVGRRLNAEGDRMAEIGHELQRAIGRLDTGAWDGRSRRRAEPLLDRVRPESERVADGLEELGRKLIRVAETFEREDSTAARNLKGMPWVDFEAGEVGGRAPGVASGIWPGIGGGTAIGGAVGGGAPWQGDSLTFPAAVSGAESSLRPGYTTVGLPTESVDIDSSLAFLGREHKLWPERRGRPRKFRPKIRATLLEGEMWGKEAKGHARLGGLGRVGGKAELQTMHGEVGVGVDWEKKGATVGAFAGGTLFSAGASYVLGDTNLGLARGVEVTAGEAEAFVGYHKGQVGAKVGGTIVSGEAVAGLNVAGWNVGLAGEAGVKFELGLTVGKKTRVHLGPFSVGLNIGEALGS